MTGPTPPEGDRGENAERSAESQRDLEQGQLPLAAQRRLAQETGGRRFFASDLSVAELLLTEAEGYEPLGVVMGSSIYHVGWQYTYSYGPTSRELEVVTTAHLHARSLAMDRMEKEAAALGGHGVVGVRFTIRPYENEANLLEFTAIGTAVRLRSGPAPARPFLSDLSGEDLWTLVQAGYRPLGLAMGFSSYFVFPYQRPYVTGGFLSGIVNQELPAFTQAVYQARHLAMGRLQDDLRQLGAEGITAVRVESERQMGEREVNSTQYLQLKVDFFVMGTAIRREAGAHSIAQPALVLNMTGLRPVRTAAGAGSALAAPDSTGGIV
jgi:uncharacterized protein YbjQ (UPF0145 family)